MPETIFFNIWHTNSPENQQALLDEMRAEAPALAAQPGFLGLSTWAAYDGKRVIVEGCWASAEHFHAAVTANPEAQSARARLESYGQPEPGLFAENFRVESPIGADATRRLREEASARWTALGFRTSVVALGEVELFTANAGSGAPLVLLHGYPQSGEIWRFVAPVLAKTRQVIIPDLPGMGLSGVPSHSCDLPSVSEDLHRMLSALNASGVDIVAHDWGAAVGALYALRHQSNVRRFAFIESALGGAGFESLWVFDKPNPAMTFIPFLLTEPLAENLLSGREEVFLRHLWNTFTYNKTLVPFAAWQPYVDAMKRSGVVHSSAGYYRAVYSAATSVRDSIAAGKLTIPVLSLSGSASLGSAQRAFVERFAAQIVRHVTIEGAGHFVAEEQPDALVAELQSFFAE